MFSPPSIHGSQFSAIQVNDGGGLQMAKVTQIELEESCPNGFKATLTLQRTQLSVSCRLHGWSGTAADLEALLGKVTEALGTLVAEPHAVAADLHEKLDRSVKSLDLSVRAENCLENHGVEYIGQLVQRTEAEMLKMKNSGPKTVREYKMALEELNLGLDMQPEELGGWIPPDQREPVKT